MHVLLVFVLLLFCDPGIATAATYNPDWGTVGVFSSAQTCAQCHRASVSGDTPPVMRFPDALGEDISPTAEWRHSIMAHSFNDPYFQAVVEDETTQFPGLAGQIEDTCLTCHAPMARTHAHQSGTDLVQDASCTLADGCYRFATASTQNPALEGVSCTLCHQVKDVNLGASASFSGQYAIATAGDPDDFEIYGPYQNPHSGGAYEMESLSGYRPGFGVQVTTSGHCATCHTLFTTALDADTDAPTGATFLEQAPFLEWQNSVYTTGASQERQCQDCHMPDPAPGAYSTRIAVSANGTVNTTWPERSPFFSHEMVGGNSHMLELLRDNRTALGLDGSTTVAGFDQKIAQTRALLQNESAVLDITQLGLSGTDLAIDVRITNKTGHKLPTAYPSRRMWLHLTVRDSIGQVLFESGAPDAQGHISTDGANLAPECLAIRKPADFSNSGCFEPHHDIIDDPARIAIYEPVLADSNGNITHLLLHANSYLKDNRIPPEGFTASQADALEPQTRPVGVDNDTDFNFAGAQEGSGSDTAHYRVPLASPYATYNVEVRLLYQSVRPAFVDGLRSSGTLVTSFKQMHAQNPSVVETLASASSSVTINNAPVANAGADQSVTVGDQVNLSAGASSDADNDPLSYTWSFVSRPAGSQAALSDPGSVNPTFSADQAGDYSLQLIVNDGSENSAPDTVTVTAVSPASTSSGGGGGGGCSLAPHGEKPDPLLPALVLVALGVLGRRYQRRLRVLATLRSASE